jgi:hypothetical protein
MPQKTQKGKIRKKRGDARVGNIEKQYGVDFGVRSDMKLSTYLSRKGLNSMGKALENIEKKKKKYDK